MLILLPFQYCSLTVRQTEFLCLIFQRIMGCDCVYTGNEQSVGACTRKISKVHKYQEEYILCSTHNRLWIKDNNKFLPVQLNCMICSLNPARYECKECSVLICDHCYIENSERAPGYFKWSCVCRSSQGTRKCEISASLGFECIWNCGIVVRNNDLLNHELFCKKRPEIHCPFGGCLNSGSFEYILDHFAQRHSDVEVCWTNHSSNRHAKFMIVHKNFEFFLIDKNNF